MIKLLVQASQRVLRAGDVVADEGAGDRVRRHALFEHFLGLLIVEESHDLSALPVREHSVLHTLLHGLSSLEHGEHWDFLVSDGVGHEAHEDGELVQHVQHEEGQERVSCLVGKVNKVVGNQRIGVVCVVLIAGVFIVRVDRAYDCRMVDPCEYPE